MRKRSVPRVSGMEASQAPEYFLSAEDAKGMRFGGHLNETKKELILNVIVFLFF